MEDIAFEHFDPEFELGNLDINGKPIKPRKKPGRKPNPPSPAQRKAQNRAAQRAFRERKRREMHDAETNIKKCLQMRDQALKEAKSLQLKVDELRYENNFLKGQLLTFKITCIANRVDVPKFWDTGKRDKMGSDETTFSRTKDIPQPLEFFWITKNVFLQYSSPPPETPQPFNSTASTTSSDNTFSSGLETFLSSPLSSSLPPDFSFDDIPNLIQSATHLDLDPTLMQYLLQPDTVTDFINQMKDVPPELWLSQVPPELVALVPPEIRSYLSQPPPELHSNVSQDSMEYATSSPQPSTPPPSVPSNFQPKIPVEGDFWMDIKDTNSSPTNKVYVAGPISPLDAVNQMRTMRDQNDNRYLLTPTELQRKVPHDPRIDLIPGPTMRDYMILFQDFYDANELFNTLISTAMFIGGELGNPDCWFVPPNFIRKYWFLCPNHRPTRLDNSVELAVFFGQKFLDSLKRRKEMYIMRDEYVDHFLEPTLDDVGRAYDEMEDDEHLGRVFFYKYLLLIDNINKEIPRIISPNPFTV
ncbi:uncharacterized protein EV154DRAFT_536856 [Mucor mucedo]|uniref:uncharacterized protein n=1 Tax=Mucor mucedo TaxID=29922 RepID=UPI002220810C|nr:uncharacterized protein EV154DRAFT_536856 [Mucor mucedo]KAI7893880.1 hypothetical protein EV154DRAFT_536856 [Mucor mucedo]